jgi:hypothetical protein
MTAALAAALATAGVARAKDCTHGQLTGGLTATYDFVAETWTVVGPTATLTGHSTITTDKGGHGRHLHGDDLQEERGRRGRSGLSGR